ncbi:MAG TPA: hypothetical protein VGL97_10595 [Bryobacteraceae bacterium]|jgi:hypothetical protein
MQHVNIKIFAQRADGVNLSEAIPVFHRWIQRRDLPEMLIDVADYSHVPAGPGVVLIAHEANYSLDCARNRLGLLYNRKAAAEEPAQAQLQQAYDSALAACLRLENEPEFEGKLRFDPCDVELTLNDRLLHPNTEESWRQIQPEVKQFFDGIFGAGAYTFTRAADPRERLRVNVAPASPASSA